MADRPVRWIVEDARKFAAREVRRGSKYDGIILDPPKYGRGPTGEVWRLFEDLPGLLKDWFGGCDQVYLPESTIARERAARVVLNLTSEQIKNQGTQWATEPTELRSYRRV